MSKGGTPSPTSTNTTNTVTQTSSPPPAWTQAYQNLTGQATAQAGQTLQQYPGSLVQGFTPLQNQAFSTIQNAQGLSQPYTNAGAQEFASATQPLWQSLPQYNTTGIPQAGFGAFGTAQQYAGAAAQPIAQTVSPYATTAQQYAGAAAQPIAQTVSPFAGTAQQYGAASVQPIAQTVSPFAGTAQQYGAASVQPIAQNVSPYAGIATGAAQNLAANTPSYGQLGTYFDPYQQYVTGATQNLMNEQNAQQLAAVGGNAASQGAFGGDRMAVAQALTAGQQQLSEAPTLANIQAQGFGQAQTELNAQQQLALAQAQTQGQLGVSAGQLMAGAYGTQGQLAQGAGQLSIAGGQLEAGALGTQGQLGLGAAQANLGAGQLVSGAMGTQGQLGLGAGQLEAGIGQQELGAFNTQQQTQLSAEQANAWLASQAGFGVSGLGTQAEQNALSGASALNTVGTAQQNLAQQQLNIPYEQFIQQQAYPYQQLNFLSGITEGTGSLAGGTSSTSYPSPGVVSQLAGLGLAGTGVLGATGAFGSNGYLTNLFGSGAAAQDFSGGAAALSAADLSGIGAVSAIPAAGTAFTDALLAATPFGFQSGGSVSGGGGQLDLTPGVPTISSYIGQPSQFGRGPGPPRPLSVNPQSLTAGELSPIQFMQGLTSLKKSGVLGGDTSPTSNSQFGGRIGSIGAHMPRMGGIHLSGLGHGLPHTGVRPGMRFQGGGMASSPLTAAAPLSGTGASPNIQGIYQNFARMPIEQLRELAVRMPPGSPYGALIQRAIQAQQMTPGAGINTQLGQPPTQAQQQSQPGPFGMQDGGSSHHPNQRQDGGSASATPPALPPAMNVMLDEQLWGSADGGRLKLQGGGSAANPFAGINPTAGAINPNSLLPVPTGNRLGPAPTDPTGFATMGTNSQLGLLPSSSAFLNSTQPAGNPGFRTPMPTPGNPFVGITPQGAAPGNPFAGISQPSGPTPSNPFANITPQGAAPGNPFANTISPPIFPAVGPALERGATQFGNITMPNVDPGTLTATNPNISNGDLAFLNPLAQLPAPGGVPVVTGNVVGASSNAGLNWTGYPAVKRGGRIGLQGGGDASAYNDPDHPPGSTFPYSDKSTSIPFTYMEPASTPPSARARPAPGSAEDPDRAFRSIHGDAPIDSYVNDRPDLETTRAAPGVGAIPRAPTTGGPGLSTPPDRVTERYAEPQLGAQQPALTPGTENTAYGRAVQRNIGAPTISPQAATTTASATSPVSGGGFSPSGLMAQRGFESGNDPMAKNPHSTAFGPDQFLAGTWLPLIKSTHPDLATGKSDQELLAMRSDPNLSAEMTQAYGRQNAGTLKQAGLPVNDTTLALSHFLGPAGATKVLRADPGTPMAQLVSAQAVAANPWLRDKTAGQVIGSYQTMMGAAAKASPAIPNVPGIGTPPQGLGPTPGDKGPFTTMATSQLGPPERANGQQRQTSDFMSSPWMIPIAVGAGMLASRSPFPGVALGEGLETGLKFAGDQQTREYRGELSDARATTAQTAAKSMADRADLARDRLNMTDQYNTAKLELQHQTLDTNSALKQAALDVSMARATAAMQAEGATSDLKRIQAQAAADREVILSNSTRWVPGYEDPKDPKSTPGMYAVPEHPTGDIKRIFVPTGAQSTAEVRATQITPSERLARIQGEEANILKQYPLGVPKGMDTHAEAVRRVDQALGPAAPGGDQTTAPPTTIPQMPQGVPAGSQYSPSRNAWRDPQGVVYDASGNKVGP